MLAAERCGTRGFTLLELLVVIAILAGLTALAFPTAMRHLEARQLDVAARLLVSDLRLLRSNAVNAEQELTLRIDASRHGYTRENDGTFRKFPPGTTIRVEALRSPTDGPEIVFFPDGTATGGRIVMARGEDEVSVDVSWPFGDIRMHD